MVAYAVCFGSLVCLNSSSCARRRSRSICSAVAPRRDEQVLDERERDLAFAGEHGIGAGGFQFRQVSQV